MPRDYRRVLEATRRAEQEGRSVERGGHGGGPWVSPPGSWSTDASCPRRRPMPVRLRDWREVYEPFPAEATRDQGARCMDCGIPFCHEGCPLGNLIPEWNDLVYRDDWSTASNASTPPTTSPSSPAGSARRPARPPACSGINADPVTIERIEYEIVERAWSRGVGPAPDPPRAHGQAGGRGRLGTGRPGRRPAAGPGRPFGRGLRAGRAARRAPALRDPRVQDGEAGARPPLWPSCGPRASSSGARPRSAAPGEADGARVGAAPRAGGGTGGGRGLRPRRDGHLGPPAAGRLRRGGPGRRSHPPA